MKTIKLNTKTYTNTEDIWNVYDELIQKMNRDELLLIRKETNLLMIAEPAINGIWTLFLDQKGNINKITLF